MFIPGVSVLALFATMAGGLHGAASPDPAGELRLELNLPSFTVHVFEGDSLISSYETTIGRPPFITPPGEYEISEIEWNPWWYPPASSWAAGREVTPPGPGNPMGRSKIRFSGPLLLHGTTESELIGAVGSHGCVRLSNEEILELSRIVVTRGEPGFDRSTLPAIEADDRDTKRLYLSNPIPFSVTYELFTHLGGGHFRLYPDVYNRGYDRVIPRARHMLGEMMPGVSVDEDPLLLGIEDARTSGEPIDFFLRDLIG